ncbi:MAG: hypothetical protein RIS47_858 [Bacteroidota bacterium]|jgi:superfamily I DNA and/or RNA helicase
MERKEIQAELSKLIRLLKMEKDEDLKQYKLRMKNSSFVERRKSGVCWYPVQIEKSSFSSTEQLMVRVSRNTEHKESHLFQSGKLVSLFSNADSKTDEDEAVSGIVNTVRDHEMLITLQTDDEPDWLHDGKIGVQLLFDENSYREMERGLKLLVENPDKRLQELSLILLGGRPPQFIEVPKINLPELNISQNEALNKVLSAKDVAIIHGPPGTGKTTTLIRAIVQTLQKETQILVCAPSNAAADLVAEKLGYENVAVVRIGNPARVTEEILSKTLDAKITKHDRYKELKSLRKSAEEYRSLGRKYKRNFGPEEREQRRALLAEAKMYRIEANMLADFIKEDVLAKTRVVVTTLVGSANIVLRNMYFSTVFIDEAAQGLEPATWLPITKASRVIFAGDHHQLPPTIKSYEAAKGGLEVTLFEKTIARTDAAVMLSEQYRMHEKIMGFSARYFYKGELRANEMVATRSIFPDDAAVEFIDTAGCGFIEETNSESRSVMNPEEMHLLFKHLVGYLEAVEALHLLDEIQNIAIISPYKAQVTLMQERFADFDTIPLFSAISINTIDSFQGQERDIVYISLVRSNERQDIGFLKDIRRMNVALTRARKKLVIIGDSSTICAHPFYNEFFDYINEIGAYRSAFEFLY